MKATQLRNFLALPTLLAAPTVSALPYFLLQRRHFHQNPSRLRHMATTNADQGESSSSSSCDHQPFPANSNGVRLVWHRRDLRLHDNWLYACDDNPAASSPSIVSIYIFESSEFSPRPSTCLPEEWDTVQTGPFAARNLIQAVQDLRQSLTKIGGTLVIRQGSALEIIPRLMRDLKATEVRWNEEPGYYEQRMSSRMKQAIADQFPGISIKTSMQYTLYHPDDLPLGQAEWMYYVPNNNKKTKKRKKPNNQSERERMLPREQVNASPDRWTGMPPIMGDFRKAARAKTSPRVCLEAPTQLLSLPPSLQSIDVGLCPTLTELMQPLSVYLESTQEASKRSFLGIPADTIKGTLDKALQEADDDQEGENRPRIGEEIALRHLDDFLQNHAATAKRNVACVEPHESARISHFLALGCLSPRKVVERAEFFGSDWIISHMTMRDFFLYACLASGAAFYRLEGIPVNRKASQAIEWKDLRKDTDAKSMWRRWASGKTGLPLVDASMRELMTTGYCSNRVRQNAASVLTKDLGLDWRAGAEWYQFLLVDHCCGANWGNWLYFSGVGPDPKQRHFRTVSQAFKYDPTGLYVKKWVPEILSVISSCQDSADQVECLLRPWDYSITWKEEMLVDAKTQYTWRDLQRLEETGNVAE